MKVTPPVPMQKYVEITVDDESKVTIEAHGFNGQGCLEATRDIERALGRAGKRVHKTAQTVKQQIKG